MNLGIIGGGRSAWAIGNAWKSGGGHVAGVGLRHGSRSDLPSLLSSPRMKPEDLASRVDTILFAVPDDELASLYGTLRNSIPESSILFHSSGAISSDVFGGHPRRFSLHPLRSLPVAGTPIDFAGTLFVWEGTAFQSEARTFVESVGGEFQTISTDGKPLYHAAAAFASNYVATLLSTAEALIQSTGLSGDLGSPLATLARSAIDNWEGGPPRFTGPIARGDASLVESHLNALARRPEQKQLYRSLGLSLCRFRRQEDPNSPRLDEIESILSRQELS